MKNATAQELTLYQTTKLYLTEGVITQFKGDKIFYGNEEHHNIETAKAILRRKYNG